MASADEAFFQAHPKPTNYDQAMEAMQAFVETNSTKPIALVTSGGTTIPLESRTVRFIDNFSVGNRGATSAEHFLRQGYAVLFLHRHRTLQPFSRHLTAPSLLDMLHVDDGRDVPVTVKEEHQDKVAEVVRQYQAVKKEGTLLQVSFVSLGDYLHLLRAACQVLHSCGPRVLLYLAAAVSDFYIPAENLPEHKIQSSSGALELSLQLVPKMLLPLVRDWVPKAYVVSFKLETDSSILMQKANQALEKYKHKLVIGNILETRRTEVVLVAPHSSPQWLRVSPDGSRDIEEVIVRELQNKHESFQQS